MVAELNTPTILSSQLSTLDGIRLCVETHNTIKICLTKDASFLRRRRRTTHSTRRLDSKGSRGKKKGRRS